MASLARLGTVFLHTLIWSLLTTSSVGIASDTNCLKSIKDSLDDPHGYLKASWNFNNNTEGFICWFTGVECWHNDENRVLNLQLSNMSLKGQFPRGISDCSSLTGLDLSNNELSGPIPSNISSILPYVTSLKLSSNKFSGEIPEKVAKLTFLNVLNLDHNQLTGRIPPEIGLLSRLRNFTVADNLLNGPVPKFSYYFSSDSFANNPELCGKPLEPCHNNKNRLLVGFVVSAVLVIIVFISCYVVWTHRKKRSNKLKQAQQMKEMPRGALT